MEHGTNLFQIQKLLGLVESTLKRSSELVTSENMGYISQVQTTHASQSIIHRNILFLSHFAPQVILFTVLKLIHWQHENLKGVRARSLLNKTTS